MNEAFYNGSGSEIHQMCIPHKTTSHVCTPFMFYNINICRYEIQPSVPECWEAYKCVRELVCGCVRATPVLVSELVPYVVPA